MTEQELEQEIEKLNEILENPLKTTRTQGFSKRQPALVSREPRVITTTEFGDINVYSVDD